MHTVFLLAHSYRKGEIVEEKLIGFYSTFDNAKQAISRLKTQNGFKDYPNDFFIRCITLNELLDYELLQECGKSANLNDSVNLTDFDTIYWLSYEHSYVIADDSWQDDVKFFGAFDEITAKYQFDILQKKFIKGELFLSAYPLNQDNWEEGFLTYYY